MSPPLDRTVWLATVHNPVLRLAVINPQARALIEPDLESGVFSQSDYTTLSEYYISKEARLTRAKWLSLLAPFPAAALFKYAYPKVPIHKSPRVLALFLGTSLVPLLWSAADDRNIAETALLKLENREGVMEAAHNAETRMRAAVSQHFKSQHLSQASEDEDPNFSDAIDTADRLRATLSRFGTLESRTPQSIGQARSLETEPNAWEPPAAASSVDRPAPTDENGSGPTTRPLSSWDRLRAASGVQQGHASSWDTLRQNNGSKAPDASQGQEGFDESETWTE